MTSESRVTARAVCHFVDPAFYNAMPQTHTHAKLATATTIKNMFTFISYNKDRIYIICINMRINMLKGNQCLSNAHGLLEDEIDISRTRLIRFRAAADGITRETPYISAALRTIECDVYASRLQSGISHARLALDLVNILLHTKQGRDFIWMHANLMRRPRTPSQSGWWWPNIYIKYLTRIEAMKNCIN